MAATGPRRPRKSNTRGSSASSHSHSGCRKRIMRPPRPQPRGDVGAAGLGGFDHEAAGASMQRFHDAAWTGPRRRTSPCRIACRNSARRLRCAASAAFEESEQVAQKLLGGAVRGGDLHRRLRCTGARYRKSQWKIPCTRRGLHERAGCPRGAAARSRTIPAAAAHAGAARPAPPGIAAGREQHGGGEPAPAPATGEKCSSVRGCRECLRRARETSAAGADPEPEADEGAVGTSVPVCRSASR